MEDRKKAIEKYRNMGWSYSSIGTLLNISKQRVHSIHKNYSSPNILLKNKVIVKKRDKNCCMKCSKLFKEKGIEIHHVDFNRNNNSINNLISLCVKCHKGVHAKKRSLSGKLNTEMLIIRMDRNLMKQLKAYAERNDNGLASVSARKAIKQFIKEDNKLAQSMKEWKEQQK